MDFMIEHEKKDKIIAIRARPSTVRKLKRVVVELNTHSYEEALLKLIDLYEKTKKQKEEVKIY